MEWTGLALLLLVALGIITTGLPAAFVLVTVATLGAIIGVASGTIPPALLWTLPARVINLFENDLLQALPLYVTMGLLLDRLPIASALYRAGNALLPRSSSAPVVSGVMLGALLGPMNGSVGASVLGLSRVISPRLDAEGVAPSTRDAVVAVASTLGVLVPPSLVLILLSDAMLSAHTIAVTQTGRIDRIINTADIFHAALVPAGIFLLLCLAVAFAAGRTATRLPPREPLSFREALLAAATVIALLTLLGGVALGFFFPVDAAALGAFALFMAGLRHGPPARQCPERFVARRHGDDRRAVFAAGRRNHVHVDPAPARHRSPRQCVHSGDPRQRPACGGLRAGAGRAVRLRARCVRDHLRCGADRDPAAAHPRGRCALGRRAADADAAVELSCCRRSATR